jgi:excisionase family DNA binding protein
MKSTDTANEFLTVDGAAQLVGMSHWTIRRWLKPGGKLTRYRAGSRVVVSRSELLELVKPKKEFPESALLSQIKCNRTRTVRDDRS